MVAGSKESDVGIAPTIASPAPGSIQCGELTEGRFSVGIELAASFGPSGVGRRFVRFLQGL